MAQIISIHITSPFVYSCLICRKEKEDVVEEKEDEE